MSLWIRLVALVLYITAVCRHIKSRRFPSCLLAPSSNYSGKRPSYIMLSSPFSVCLWYVLDRKDISASNCSISLRYCLSCCPTVGDYSTVHFDRNEYSVPIRFLRKSVTVKEYANKVVIICDADTIVTYERLSGQGKTAYKPEHYIGLLERKPLGK